MKRLFAKNSLIAILIILLVGLTAVGCFPTGGNTTADKAALEAEIAQEIVEQGDYTLDSFNAYRTKLEAAQAIVADDTATQEDVDAALAALTDARMALVIRPIEALDGANKSFHVISGGSREVNVADYVNVNGLSKITYDVKVSNAVLSKTSVVDGKFTLTAGEVSEVTDVTVSINVSYDGVKKLTVELAVQITNDTAPTLYDEAIVKDYDLFDLENKESLTIDFAKNVDNAGDIELEYSVTCDGEDVALDGTLYTITFGSYNEVAVSKTFVVTVSCVVNGEERTLEYTYTVSLKDTSAYRVANGNFENGLEGWEIINTEGEAPFAGIDDKTTFWGEEFAMFNVGKYFSSYADGAAEPSQGTLASSYFVVNSKYATYMLGGAGNHNVYITIENKNGDVLAIYRNTKFADLPAGDYSLEEKREMIGNSVFLANFVTYKVDIEAFAGQEIRFVIHDHASNNWGVVFFDELNTYYASEDMIPENAVLAENLLANKTALEAELALAVTEQGDFTLDSFSAYVTKLDEAKKVAGDDNGMWGPSVPSRDYWDRKIGGSKFKVLTTGWNTWLQSQSSEAGEPGL